MVTSEGLAALEHPTGSAFPVARQKGAITGVVSWNLLHQRGNGAAHARPPAVHRRFRGRSVRPGREIRGALYWGTLVPLWGVILFPGRMKMERRRDSHCWTFGSSLGKQPETPTLSLWERLAGSLASDLDCGRTASAGLAACGRLIGLGERERERELPIPRESLRTYTEYAEY